MESGKKPSDPKLADVLKQLKKDIFLSLNCHAIATVEVFNPANQTITASMAYKKTFLKFQNGQESETLVDYPVMLDCPAVVIGGGPFSLKMPISPGDECLILFNDRSIDKWFEAGQVTALGSSRLHSFSDAIALVGINSSKNSLSGYSLTQAIMGDGTHDLKLGEGEASLNVGTTVVKAGVSQILLTNAIESLGTILQDLMTELQLLTVTGVTTGPAASGPPANVANLILIANRLGVLLE